MSNLLVPAIAHLAVPEDVSLEEPFTIKDFKAISSYTWSHEKNPTIIVPGECIDWHIPGQHSERVRHMTRRTSPMA